MTYILSIVRLANSFKRLTEVTSDPVDLSDLDLFYGHLDEAELMDILFKLRERETVGEFGKDLGYDHHPAIEWREIQDGYGVFVDDKLFGKGSSPKEALIIAIGRYF